LKVIPVGRKCCHAATARLAWNRTTTDVCGCTGTTVYISLLHLHARTQPVTTLCRFQLAWRSYAFTELSHNMKRTRSSRITGCRYLREAVIKGYSFHIQA